MLFGRSEPKRCLPTSEFEDKQFHILTSLRTMVSDRLQDKQFHTFANTEYDETEEERRPMAVSWPAFGHCLVIAS
jgi:hypothetical protein